MWNFHLFTGGILWTIQRCSWRNREILVEQHLLYNYWPRYDSCNVVRQKLEKVIDKSWFPNHPIPVVKDVWKRVFIQRNSRSRQKDKASWRTLQSRIVGWQLKSQPMCLRGIVLRKDCYKRVTILNDKEMCQERQTMTRAGWYSLQKQEQTKFFGHAQRKTLHEQCLGILTSWM